MSTTDNPTKENAMENKRKIKREYDNYVEQINLKTNICLQLEENKKSAEKELASLLKEKQFREQRLSELRTQYDAIKGQVDESNKNTVQSIKAHIIRKELEKLISNKIPELGLQADRNPAEALRDGDFKNLLHDTVQVIYTKYEENILSNTNSTNKYEETRFFKISKKSTFAILKNTACLFWELDNPDNYLLTTDEEALIYNEDMLIDDYMRMFSVRSNIIRLIKEATLKARTKVLPIQEDRCRDLNQVNTRAKSDVRKNLGGGGDKLNEFLRAYPMMSPYCYINKNILNNKEGQIKDPAKNIETSFIMIILNILLFIFTLLLLIRKDYEPMTNYRKIKSINKYFNFDTQIFDNTTAAYLHLYDNIMKIKQLEHNENNTIGFAISGNVAVIIQSVKITDDCEYGLYCFANKFSKKNINKQEHTHTASSSTICPLSNMNLYEYKKKGQAAHIGIWTEAGHFTGIGDTLQIDDDFLDNVDDRYIIHI